MLTQNRQQELKNYYQTLNPTERHYLWSLYQCELVKKAHKAKLTRRDNCLSQILEYLKQHKTISNDQIEKLTGVKHSSAVRYMDQLEVCGKVIQIGKIGRGVKYKLVEK